MPSSLSLRTCSPWQWGKLSLLLLAGMSIPRSAAFNHGSRLLLLTPTNTFSQAKSSPGGVPRCNTVTSTSSAPRAGSLTMSAGGINNKKESKSKGSTVPAIFLGTMAFISGISVSNAASTAAAAVSGATVAPLVLPTITRLALVCLLPTLLGYYKSEYGVSYGYGTSMAASSYLILSSIANAAGLPLFPAIQDSASFARVLQPAGMVTLLSTTLSNLQSLLPASLPAFHAFAILFYGTRLDMFLLYRELFLARFRAMRERIEERAKKQGSRWKRTPFLLSCAFLYFCMMSPLLITSQVCSGISMTCGPNLGLDGGLASILELSLRFSVVMALLGFLLGAFGDLNKTVCKALRGEDELVTGGIFRFLRHPNYTGEVIGWVSSCLAGFLAVIWKTVSIGSSGGRVVLCKSMAPYLLLSVMGATGISFVLMTATTGLEFRQKEKYGGTDEYQQWIKKKLGGFQVGTKRG